MREMTLEYWGVDLETSGVDLNKHVPIQVGIVAPNGEKFTSGIGGWQFDKEPSYNAPFGVVGYPIWDVEAQRVHGLEMEVINASPYNFQVAKAAAQFVSRESDVGWNAQRLMVGWNIASFDMQFINKHMPELGKQFSYRSVDLNALCFAITNQSGHLTYNKLRQHVDEVVLEELGYENKHDALWDAEAALAAFDYLSSLTDPDMTIYPDGSRYT